MTSEVIVPEIMGSASVLIPSGVDLHLQTLLTEWLLTCGGAETRKAYGGDFREFCGFIDKGFGRISWDNITGIGASAFAAWLKNRLEKREIAPTTAARKLASVSAFLEFCISRGELQRNILAKVKRPRVPKQPKSVVLSDNEVRRFLDLVTIEREEAEKGKLLAPIRAARFNEVVFKTLLGTGCRISELLGLRFCDIDVCGEHARLHFRSKGSEDHSPIVPREIVSVILDFAIFVGFNKANDFIFLPFNTKESAEKRIGRELVRLCKKAGIEKAATPHVLRATVATSLHAKGVPVVHIQRLLNHKDISTTAVYIRQVNEKEDAASMKVLW